MPPVTARVTTRNYVPPVEDGGYTEGLTVTLAPIVQPGVNAAPSAVFFEVSDVTGSTAGAPTNARIPKYHDITYVWDFGDSANATPSNAADLNMPTAWKDINRGYGMQAAHVYGTPGTYTVTVTAYEPGSRRKGSASVEVTIGDPKTVFPTTRTIIFNPNSVDLTPYGYTGANVITTTWADVISARNANAAQTGQILIAPGVTISNTQLCSSPSWVNIRIGGIDPAIKPVVSGYTNEGNFIVRDYNTSKSERVVFGLRFEGDWDAATETGLRIIPFGTFNVTSSSYLAMQHRCEFDGMRYVGPYIGAETDAIFNVHSELTVTNWQDYGLHGGNDITCRTAVIACSVAQHPDALSGGSKDDGFYNNHGPFRSFTDGFLYMSVCDFFSRNGWSPGGNGLDGIGIPAEQAGIRINTNGSADTKTYADRIALEGSIWMEEQSSGPHPPGNHVFDKVIQIIGPTVQGQGVLCRYGGSTFRNMHITTFDRPAAQENQMQKAFFLSNANGAAGNDCGVNIHNVTFADRRTNTNAGGETVQLRENDSTTFAVQTVQNNVFEQPNRSPPSTPDAPIDLTTAITFTPRHRGLRWGFRSEAGTLSASVANDNVAYFALSYADVRTTRYNTSGVDTGAATDQAYWLANAGTRHKLNMAGVSLHTSQTQFRVSFEASEIRIYNRTGAAWPSGAAWELSLDRRGALPAWVTDQDVRALTVPIARPTTGSAGIGDGDSGLRAYDDLLLAVRPATGDTRGALLPA